MCFTYCTSICLIGLCIACKHAWRYTSMPGLLQHSGSLIHWRARPYRPWSHACSLVACRAGGPGSQKGFKANISRKSSKSGLCHSITTLVCSSMCYIIPITNSDVSTERYSRAGGKPSSHGCCHATLRKITHFVNEKSPQPLNSTTSLLNISENNMIPELPNHLS